MRPRWCTKRTCGWSMPARWTGRTAPTFSPSPRRSCGEFSSMPRAPAPRRSAAAACNGSKTTTALNLDALPAAGHGSRRRNLRARRRLGRACQTGAAPREGDRAAVFRRAERRGNGRSARRLSANRLARLEAGAGVAGGRAQNPNAPVASLSAADHLSSAARAKSSSRSIQESAAPMAPRGTGRGDKGWLRERSIVRGPES